MIEDDVMIIYVGVYIGNGEMAVVYDCHVVKESESMCFIGEVSVLLDQDDYTPKIAA